MSPTKIGALHESHINQSCNETHLLHTKMVQNALCTKENMTEPLVHQLPLAASITLNSQLRTMPQTQQLGLPGLTLLMCGNHEPVPR